MESKMKRELLKRAMTILKSAVRRDESRASSNCVAFTGDYIVALNDHVTILKPFPTKFKGFLNFPKLSSYVSKVRSGEILFKESGGCVIVQTKDTKAKFPLISDEFEENIISINLEYIEDCEWKEVPEQFIDSIVFCEFATLKSSDSDSDILKFIFIKESSCFASNNVCIARHDIGSGMDGIFILNKDVSVIQSFDPTEFALNDNCIFFKNDDDEILITKRVQSDSPDFDKFFDISGVKIHFGEEILNNVDLSEIFASKNDKCVHIKVKNNTVFISSGSSSNSFKSKIKLDKKTKDIEFSINPEYMKSLLSVNFDMEVDELMAIALNDNCGLIVALMRD
jgi:hypothetical protein